MRESEETASGRVQPPGDRAAAPNPALSEREKAGHEAHSLVIVASRLPVDRIENSDGEASWRPSPGGLVTALEPVMRSSGGVWIGWSGDAGPAPGPFKAGGLHLVGLGLSADQIRDYYEGFCNATLWPLYHDVIAPPRFHRRWWDAYVAVNRYFAEEADRQAGPGGDRLGAWTTSCSSSRNCCASGAATSGSAISPTYRFPATRSSPSFRGAGASWRGCSARICWAFSAGPMRRTSCGPAAGRPAW